MENPYEKLKDYDFSSDSNDPTFRELLEKALRGDADAQYEMGEYYFYGLGGDDRMDEDCGAQIFEWYRKAAEQGHAGAQYCLAMCYYDGDGVEENEDTAVYWYIKSAEQGFIDAQQELGVLYRDGYGAEPGGWDKEKAVYWFTKAAEQGDSFSKAALADLSGG